MVLADILELCTVTSVNLSLHEVAVAIEMLINRALNGRCTLSLSRWRGCKVLLIARDSAVQ